MLNRATQKSVAERCGVSAACVGYILSGKSKYRFRKETVERVRKTAEALHYSYASSLRKKENRLILCIVGGCCRYSDTLHIQKLCDETGKRGYTLLVHFLVGLSDDQKVEFLRRIINLPAGIIIWSLGIRDPGKKRKSLQILKKGPPALDMSEKLPGSGADYVKILWNCESLTELMDFFVSKGFHRIGGCFAEITSKAVGPNFVSQAEKAGLEVQMFTAEQKTPSLYDVGWKIAKQILAAEKRPEALYCLSDEMAYTMIDELRHHGIEVPRDMFIVSGGDSEFLKNCTEPPPYLIHDISKLVSMAADDLIERIEAGRQDSGTERCVGTLGQKLYFP